MNLPACTVCGAAGAWTCSSCGPKCADHVRRKRGALVRFTCTQCQQLAELQRLRRAELAPFRDRALHALTNGLLGYPILAMLVGGLAFSLSGVVDILGSLLGLVVTLALGLAVLRAAADDVPFTPERLTDPVEDLVIPLARGLAALLPLLIVVHVYVNLFVVFPYERLTSHAGGHSLPVTLLISPWFWLAALSAVAYAPMALLNAAVAPNWGAVFNPLSVVKEIRKRQYEFKVLSAVAGAGSFATLLLAIITPAGWFGALFTGIAAAGTGIAVMRVLGELIYLHPEQFEWGHADEGWVDLGDPAAPALEEAVVQTEPVKTATVSLEARIKAALDAKDAKLAVGLYKETLGGNQSQLAQATLTRVGQAAAFLEEYSLAVATLLAASAENVPESAKPLLLAAMILDERLRDQSGAKRLFLQVIQRFPETQAAERARKELADPRFLLETRTG